MRRIELSLAGIKVNFADREDALKRIEDWAGGGTYLFRLFMVRRAVVRRLG
uniref:hypothetical protein n=1 Tax=Vulcanisaeta sp. JCM 14467 TaxID=1295370 RepID=UPI003182CBF8